MDRTGLKSFLESKLIRGILAGIGFFIILLFVFKAGEIIGFRKAGFSYQWGENYERNFGGPGMRFPLDMHEQGFLGGHGTIGNIMSANSSTLTVQEQGGMEKIIGLTQKTVVRKLQNTITAGDLVSGDHVVIIGTPDTTGQIEAKLIRVIPAPSPLPSNGPQQ
jgi:hypothetical protein